MVQSDRINFERDVWIVVHAKYLAEENKHMEAGFEWVGKDDDGLTFFRKRK